MSKQLLRRVFIFKIENSLCKGNFYFNIYNFDSSQREKKVHIEH